MDFTFRFGFNAKGGGHGLFLSKALCPPGEETLISAGKRLILLYVNR